MLPNLKLLVYIGVAGFIGAVSRYAVSGYIHSVFGSRFPYGTLAVNVLGSLLLGFAYTLSVERNIFSPELRLVLTVGFLGSLTTFSTFSFETWQLLSEGSLFPSIANIAANLALSIAAVVLGIALAKVL